MIDTGLEYASGPNEIPPGTRGYPAAVRTIIAAAVVKYGVKSALIFSAAAPSHDRTPSTPRRGHLAAPSFRRGRTLHYRARLTVHCCPCTRLPLRRSHTTALPHQCHHPAAVSQLCYPSVAAAPWYHATALLQSANHVLFKWPPRHFIYALSLWITKDGNYEDVNYGMSFWTR